MCARYQPSIEQHSQAMSPLKSPDKSGNFDPMLEHSLPAAGAGSPVSFASSSIHSPAGRGHGRASAPPMATTSRQASADAQGKVKKVEQTQLAHPSTFKAEDLEQYFKGLFSIADANGDGVLQPDELEKLLQLCGFALSAEEIAQFVSEADTNHDGVIEYDEFVPVATKMLQATAPNKKKVSNAAV